MNLTIGAKVVFKKNVDEHGVPAGSIGHIDDGLNCHVLASSEFPCGDNSVYVSVCGKVLILPVEFFSDAKESENLGRSNLGTSEGAGIESVGSIGSGASVGQVGGSGSVESGASVGAGSYSVAQAIGDLANLAVQIDHDGDSVSSSQVLEIVGKLQTIAA